MDQIHRKEHPSEFNELCEKLLILYPSTVRHFEQDIYGIYRPVFWEYPKKEVPDA